jgi:phosphoribosylaminoimidazole-succinocarboxamide synthase
MPTEMLWGGSSKDVLYDREKGELKFHFSDRVSVFDLGPMPVLFPGLGELRCTIATRLWKKLDEAGFRTHFRGRLTDTEISVEPFNIPEKDRVFEGARGRLLPLEILFRYVATEKFCARVAGGKVDRAVVERLLYEGELVPGARFKPPFVECSTKHQAADDYINDESAAILAGVSVGTLHSIYHEVRTASDFLHTFLGQAGFGLMDGKCEGALLWDGTFVFADAVSPDELRLVGRDGKSYDKDPTRKWYEDNYPTWVKMLRAAKEKFPNDKSKWPGYPGPPAPEVVTETIRRYREVANALVSVMH